ncbi:hypothetical protein DFJ77DRAFT_194553 [Powellomyces hirtus]|nr:hypothetical protein DFJ77DRAFT_194553 [Powellomyces hirtus]
MTSAFPFHEGAGESVRWQAKYLYPTQGNRAWKPSAESPSTNGSSFSSDNYGASIEIRLPTLPFKTRMCFSIPPDYPAPSHPSQVDGLQLSIFRDLATVADCLVQDADTNLFLIASFTLSNIFLNCQLLEFDGTYDAAFLEGLRGDSVALKFSTWNTFQTQIAPCQAQIILLPDRNRSLKSTYTVQVSGEAATIDSHPLVQSSASASGALSVLAGSRWAMSLSVPNQRQVLARYHRTKRRYQLQRSGRGRT